MYILNEKAKELLRMYKLYTVAKTVGINTDTLSKMIKQNKPCIKITAYCITKFLNSDAEIEDYFEKKGE